MAGCELWCRRVFVVEDGVLVCLSKSVGGVRDFGDIVAPIGAGSGGSQI